MYNNAPQHLDHALRTWPWRFLLPFSTSSSAPTSTLHSPYGAAFSFGTWSLDLARFVEAGVSFPCRRPSPFLDVALGCLSLVVCCLMATPS